MTLERILKWLSALILLYFAMSYILGSLAVDQGGMDSLLVIMGFALPGVVCIVAAYRQLFKPRPYLVLAAAFISFAFYGLLFILFFILPDTHTLSDEVSIDLTTYKDTIKASLFPALLQLLLFGIPIYSNFKRYRDRGHSSPVT